MNSIIHCEISQNTENIYRKYLRKFCSSDCESIIISYLIWDVKKGDIIDVFCRRQNDWYTGIVLDLNNERIYVHFIGYQIKWNSWKNIDEILPYNEMSNKKIGKWKRFINHFDNIIPRVEQNENRIIFIRKNDNITRGYIINVSHDDNSNTRKIKYSMVDRKIKKIYEIIDVDVNSFVEWDNYCYLFITATEKNN